MSPATRQAAIGALRAELAAAAEAETEAASNVERAGALLERAQEVHLQAQARLRTAEEALGELEAPDDVPVAAEGLLAPFGAAVEGDELRRWGADE